MLALSKARQRRVEAGNREVLGCRRIIRGRFALVNDAG